MKFPHLVFAILACSASVQAAEQINFRATPGSTNLTSTNQPLGSGEEQFVFELGAFAAGFNPSASNTADWAANWTPLGRASYNTTTRWFTESTILTSNSAPFTAAGAAYFWGHDTGGEWILLTNPSWKWPIVTGSGGNPNPEVLTFSVSDSGTIALHGSVNGSGFQMQSAAATGEIPDIDPQQWSAQYFSASQLTDPTISGPQADPDADGASNLQELASGTDPRDPSSNRSPQFQLHEESGETYIELVLKRNGRAQITHAAETSADLNAWAPSPAGFTIIEDSSTQLILRSNTPIAATSRQFYRITFSLVAG